MTPNDDTLARARERLAALRAAERAATPGPWAWYEGYDSLAPRSFVPPKPDYGPETAIVHIPSGDAVLHGVWRNDDYADIDAKDADRTAILALRNAASALLALADAVARLVAAGGVAYALAAYPWWVAEWSDADRAGTLTCIGCHANASAYLRPGDIVHAADCPALAIDAALAWMAGEA